MLSRLARGSAESISTEKLATGLTVTVNLFRADGTQLLTDEAATEGSGDEAGFYELVLSPTETGEIDRLRAEWRADGATIEVSFHDVVGAHYFSVESLRKLDPLDKADVYSDRDLRFYRDLGSYALEGACGVTWTERYSEHTFDGTGSDSVIVQQAGITEILGAAIDGVATGTPKLLSGGEVKLQDGERWTAETSCIVRLIRAYMAFPPPREIRAMKLIAKHFAFSDAPGGRGSGIPDRATSLSTSDGSFSLITAGARGATFDVPEANAVVEEYAGKGQVFYV